MSESKDAVAFVAKIRNADAGEFGLKATGHELIRGSLVTVVLSLRFHPYFYDVFVGCLLDRESIAGFHNLLTLL